MDFVFRAIYKPGSVYSNPSPSSSDYNYFTKQAIECYNGYSRFLGSREAMIEREMEKERIRREMLSEEAAMRRRVLEAEVRRELMVERERRRENEQQHALSEIRSLEEKFGLPRHERLQIYPVFGHRKIEGYEEGLPLNEAKSLCEAAHSYSVLGHHNIRGDHEGLPLELATQPMKTKAEFRSGLLPPLSSGYGEIKGKDDELPFQRRPQPRKTEIAKSPSKVINMMDEEKTIFSGKPDTNHSGTKRKGEWSCDLCHITATSEMGLKDHLIGKKHKAKKAKVGRKAGKIGFFSETGSNPLKPSQVREKVVSIFCNVVAEKFRQVSSKSEAKMECERPLQKKSPHKKKYWCEICQVRAFSEKVMNDHMKGKRHISRLNEYSTKNEAVGSQMVEKTGTN